MAAGAILSDVSFEHHARKKWPTESSGYYFSQKTVFIFFVTVSISYLRGYPNGCPEVLQLLIGDVPVLLWRVPHHPPPGEAPGQAHAAEHVEDGLPTEKKRGMKYF